jgi:hypothetical protein
MRYNEQQANALTAGIWLIGFGILFATKLWWPGIMFLVGITAIVQGLVQRRGWYAIHGGFWAILIGVWAALKFSMAVFFIGMGIYVILSAFLNPGFMRKPYVDNTLE